MLTQGLLRVIKKSTLLIMTIAFSDFKMYYYMKQQPKQNHWKLVKKIMMIITKNTSGTIKEHWNTEKLNLGR